jgi:homoserine O-succinyltransferase
MTAHLLYGVYICSPLAILRVNASMPINIPADLPGTWKILLKWYFCDERCSCHPVKISDHAIGILNLVPNKTETELQNTAIAVNTWLQIDRSYPN